MARKAYNGYTEKSYYENKKFSGMVTTGDVLSEGNFYTMYNTTISDTGLSVKPRKGFLTTTIKNEDDNYITLSNNTIYYRDPESNSTVFVDLDTLSYNVQPEEGEQPYTLSAYVCNVSEYTTDTATKSVLLDGSENNRTINKILINNVEDNIFDWLYNYYNITWSNRTKIRAVTHKGTSVFDKYAIQRYVFKCDVLEDNEHVCYVYLLVNYNKQDNAILLRVLDTKEQYSILQNDRNLASDQSIIPNPIQVYDSTDPDSYNTFPFIYNKHINRTTGNTEYIININDYTDVDLLPSFRLLQLNDTQQQYTKYAYAYDIYNSTETPTLSKDNVYHSPVYLLDDCSLLTNTPSVYNSLYNPNYNALYGVHKNTIAESRQALINVRDDLKQNKDYYKYVFIVPKGGYQTAINYNGAVFTPSVTLSENGSYTPEKSHGINYTYYTNFVAHVIEYISLQLQNTIDKTNNIFVLLNELNKDLNSCNSIVSAYEVLSSNKYRTFLDNFEFIEIANVNSLYNDTQGPSTNIFNYIDCITSNKFNYDTSSAAIQYKRVYTIDDYLTELERVIDNHEALNIIYNIVPIKLRHTIGINDNTTNRGGFDTDFTIACDAFLDYFPFSRRFLYNITKYSTTTTADYCLNVSLLYKFLTVTQGTLADLLKEFVYFEYTDNDNYYFYYLNTSCAAAYVGKKTFDDLPSLLLNTRDIDINTDVMFKKENGILQQSTDAMKLLNTLNNKNFFYNNVFNFTMYISRVTVYGDRYVDNIDRDTFVSTAGLRQSIVLPYKENDDYSVVEEVITKEPEMIENSDGFTVFTSVEGDRIIVWKDNQVFMSDISTGADINNFTEAFRWKFEEPILKCVPYKKIVMVFSTQNLYAIYPYETTTPVETQTTDEETGKTTTTTENVKSIIYRRTCVLYNIMPNKRYINCVCIFNQLVFFYGNEGQLYLIKPVTTIDDDTRFSLQLLNKSINDVFLNYTDYINIRLKQYGIPYTCSTDEIKISAHATIDKIKIIYSVPGYYTMFVIYDTLNNTFSIEDTTSFTNVLDNLLCDSGDIYTTLCNNALRLSYKYAQPNELDTNVDASIDDNYIKRDVLMSLDTGDIALNNHLLKRFKTLKIYYKNLNTKDILFNVATFVDGSVVYTTTSNSMEIRDMNGSTTIIFNDDKEHFNELNGLTTLTFVDDNQYKEISEDKFMLFDFSSVISSKTITNETSIISTGKDIRFRFNFKSKGLYKFLGYSIIFKEHHV